MVTLTFSLYGQLVVIFKFCLRGWMMHYVSKTNIQVCARLVE